MKKILVPTDFSQNSKNALRAALGLAAKTGAQVEVLHVNTAAAYAPVLPDYYVAEAAAVEEYATVVANDLRMLKREMTEDKAFAGVALETRIEEGFLHTTMNEIAEEDGCDLVVMGTKGATGAVEFFVGSNTEKVIRTSICPVLAVPETAQDFNPRTVVLATTLRPDQAVAFEMVVAWQQIFDFDVKILYLNNPGGFDSMAAIESAEAEFRKAYGLKNADLFTASNTFDEEKSILKFADGIEADLIVMATHQRRGISHLMFGSLTEDTANHSDIPVLCVPIKG